ncbi:MAG: hypothetical protein AAFV25_08170 [Bacteroidota bacterium]
MKNYLYILFPFVLLGCANPQKLLDKQKYDRAFEVSSNRLKYGRVKSDHLSALEQSFASLTQRDLLEVERLRRSGQAEAWLKIHSKAYEIQDRQERLQPILERVRQKGHSASIRLYPVDELIAEARDNCALLYYSRAQEYMPAARNGDRLAARDAYGILKHTYDYRDSFRDTDALRDEMYELATTNVLILIDNGVLQQHEADWTFDQFFENTAYPLRHGWQVFHLEMPDGTSAQQELNISISKLQAGPPTESSSSCSNSKDVVVDTETLEEWSEADSAYVQVEKEIIQTVTFGVTTYEQSKLARAHFDIVLRDVDTGEIIDSKLIKGFYCWSNEYTESWGDDRAEDISCCEGLGSPSDFPSDRHVLSSAIRSGQKKFLKSMDQFKEFSPVALNE